MTPGTRAVLTEFDANPAAMAAEIARLRARLAELEPVHRSPVGFRTSGGALTDEQEVGRQPGQRGLGFHRRRREEGDVQHLRVVEPVDDVR